jgi:hypothetical protein
MRKDSVFVCCEKGSSTAQAGEQEAAGGGGTSNYYNRFYVVSDYQQQLQSSAPPLLPLHQLFSALPQLQPALDASGCGVLAAYTSLYFKNRTRMQSSGPAALPESDLNVANQRLAAAESNLSLLQSGGAATLKQKMLIKKAEEHVAEMRKAQEV